VPAKFHFYCIFKTIKFNLNISLRINFFSQRVIGKKFAFYLINQVTALILKHWIYWSDNLLNYSTMQQFII